MQGTGHNPARIEAGKYRAEVLRGGTLEPFWYYIIQRKDSNEILDLAKFASYEQAVEAARRTLAQMNSEAEAC